MSSDRDRALAISVALWSLARLGTPPPGWWLDAALEQIEQLSRKGHVRPQEAAMALWSLGKCGAKPMGRMDQAVPGLVSSACGAHSSASSGGESLMPMGQLGPPEMVALITGLTSMGLTPAQVRLRVQKTGGRCIFTSPIDFLLE